MLHESRLAPRYLELEVTERVLMAEAKTTTATFHARKDLGVQLTVDDFGTGFSSLGYLSRFPIDTLKLDQSFLRGASLAPPDPSIIEAAIGMGNSLNLSVVAEGVETEEELSLLRRFSCSEGQGYYFSRPAPSDQFASLLLDTVNSQKSTIQ